MKDEIIEDLPIVSEVETNRDREPRRYEIGYLLVPIIAAETIPQTVETLIRTAITTAGGQIISGEEPRLIPLAYSIRKVIENKNLRFQEAYFASCRFSLSPDQLVSLDHTLRSSPLLLRFLILELPTIVEESARRSKTETPATLEKVKAGSPPTETMSQAEMDREIEGLLAATS